MNIDPDIIDFVLEHYGPARKWGRTVVDSWLRWHAGQGFLLGVLGDNRELVGAGIVRPVMNPEDAADHYVFDPEGSCLFVDLVIGTQPGAITAIGFAALKRFGMREKVAWKRAPYYVTEVHSARRLRKHLLRKALTYGRP